MTERDLVAVAVLERGRPVYVSHLMTASEAAKMLRELGEGEPVDIATARHLKAEMLGTRRQPNPYLVPRSRGGRALR